MRCRYAYESIFFAGGVNSSRELLMLRYPFSRLGYPVKIRLYWGLFAALPVFSLFLYVATFSRGWLSLARQLYLLSGILLGTLWGWLETNIVIRRLREKVEVTVWQILPLGLALSCLPLLAIIHLFGGGEVLPFAIYFYLPCIVALSVASGLLFRRFENEKGVQVFMFVYGYKYWIETPATVDVELPGFVNAVISRDFSWILLYGKHYEKLSERLKGLEPEVQESYRGALDHLFEVLSRVGDHYKKGFRFVVSSFLSYIVYMVVVFVWMALFGLDPNIGAPLLFVPSFLIFGFVAVRGRFLTKRCEGKVLGAIRKIDSTTFSNLKAFAKTLAE